MQLQSNILLQVVGSTKKLGYGNDIDLRGFYNGGLLYERHTKLNNTDLDAWNLKFAIKCILRGLNSCPVLYSSLFGNNYVFIDSIGQNLINNRNKLRSSKLKSGTISYCDNKIKKSYNKNNKLHTGKYIYYAITDMFEMIEIIKTYDCVYPLSFNNDEINIIYNLKELNKDIEFGYKWYNNLKSELLTLKIPEQGQIKWFKENKYI